MSLGVTWYGVEDAATKYSLDTSLILKWVEDGLVRAEFTDRLVVRVNIDDIDLKVQEMTGF